MITSFSNPEGLRLKHQDVDTIEACFRVIEFLLTEVYMGPSLPRTRPRLSGVPWNLASV
jgi:hypothetical protein